MEKRYETRSGDLFVQAASFAPLDMLFFVMCINTMMKHLLIPLYVKLPMSYYVLYYCFS